jgi:hypothetical protein
MIRVVGLAVVAGLVGCAPPPPAGTVQGRCQQQVEYDPAVQAVVVQGVSRGMDVTWQAQLSRARLKSYNDCMIAAGAAPPGGVEPVDRARYGTGWY